MKSQLHKVPRRYRRPFVVFSAGTVVVIATLAAWLVFPTNRDAILGWGGMVFGALILAVELLYIAILGEDNTEVFPDFDRVFRRTMEIIRWCDSDPKSELVITTATPVFGLELEPKQRKAIADLLRARIANGRKTRMLCLDPRAPGSSSPSPLEQFCTALANSSYTNLNARDLILRARDDLIEFGQLAISQECAQIRIGPEPPHNVILATASNGDRKGLLYLASTSTLNAKVDVKGLEIDDNQFGLALSELFEYMWKGLSNADYVAFDQRTHNHLVRDRELLKFYQAQTTDYRDVEVGGIALRVYRDVFPPDRGFGIPLILSTIDNAARRFANIPREQVVGIDVGTGSGILAMKLAEHCGTVFATDSMEAAVHNAKLNLQQLKDARKDFEFDVLHGDLLLPAIDRLRNATNLMIVFNHPYYPSPLNLYGTLVPDAGTAIIDRFLAQSRKLLEGVNGVVLMPYSPIAAEHNPLNVAAKHGMSAVVDEYHARDEHDVCLIQLTAQATNSQSG